MHLSIRPLLIGCALGWSGLACAGTEEEVRATFERFVQVQNAHDVKALAGLLADSPQFLWTTRGVAVWGREAALARFAKLYEGTWKLEPELAGLRVVPMGDNVAQLHVPVVFTAGAAGQPPQVVRNFINQVLVKKDGAWRVMSIFPVPAPAQ
jgi:uncharacterized protein (TIGR02246 family)